MEIRDKITGKTRRLVPGSLQAFTAAPAGAVQSVCHYLATDRMNGFASLDIEVIMGFTLFDIYLVDIENLCYKRVRLDHQIELYPGDRIYHGRLIRATKHANA